MKIKKLIILSLTALIAALTLASCGEASNPADEYIGVYRMQERGYDDVSLSIYDGEDNICDVTGIVKITEYGIYSKNRMPYDEETFTPVRLDAGLVQAINGDLALIGKNIRIGKESVEFEDSGAVFSVDEIQKAEDPVYRGESYEFRLAPAEALGGALTLKASYYSSAIPRKFLRFSLNKSYTNPNGQLFDYKLSFDSILKTD